MKVAIVGGGISGLATAYYIKKFALPVSQILIYESSSRFGGWIDSKKIEHQGDQVYFEKGPRTLRIATGELKELNSLQLAEELKLGPKIDLIPKSHPASLNRYIYSNNKINPVTMNLLKKTDLFPKRLISYMWKEYKSPARDPQVEDESIWSFISRRFDSSVADNLVDPLFKGICGGDIKNLSAAAMLKNFYEFEKTHGSILKGALNKSKGAGAVSGEQQVYQDLVDIRKHFTNQSVWRIKTGMQELVESLVEKLSKEENVKFYLNEPVESLDFLQENNKEQVQIKSKSTKENVDVVVSGIYSKYLANLLPEKYDELKANLSRIESISMAVVNLYFNKEILPIKGFGYLVATKEKSPILGCIFDSVFNSSDQKNTVLTAMLGGAWYDEVIGNKSSEEIFSLAFNELKNHLRIGVSPDVHEVSIIKNCIPQYKVGHPKLLNEINKCLSEKKLNEKLYLTGSSYEGIGLNDSIFNARKLVQNVLAKHPLLENNSK